MATYVVLARFTAQGVKNAKDSPKRAEAFKQMADTFGVTVKDIFWTQGRLARLPPRHWRRALSLQQQLSTDHRIPSCHRVGQRRTEARPSVFRGEAGTDTLVTRTLVRRRFGIAGVITINPLLPHLHEGAGS
jgi:DNA-binding XRE family transcriptional regulator